jgi:hypothetical protein
MKIKQEQIEQYDYVFSDYIDKVESKYAARIGQFFIAFSSLEHTLDISIAQCISDRSHDLGYLVLEGNNLYSKIELYRKLSQAYVRLVRPNKSNKLATLVRRLHEVRVFRNYLSHANWPTLESSGYVRTKVAEKEGEIILKKVRITPKTIDAWNRKVQRLDEQLDEFAETQFD